VKKQIPVARTERKPLFDGRVDYVVLEDGRGIVVPAAVLSLVDKRFVERAFARVPKQKRLLIKLGDSVVVSCESPALCEAVIDLWRGRLPKDEMEVAKEMVHEIISTVTGNAKARGAVNALFGGELFR
jgi:hypothetical protein